MKAQLDANPELAQARIVDEGGGARTLLHIASDWPGHFPHGPQTVSTLIAAGTEVSAPMIHSKPNSSAETPLHWAASSDDIGVLDALLDGGADIEAPGAIFTGGPAMSDAVVFAQWRAARRLLERGATTTIWQAAALGLLDEVREHLSAGPPPPPRQITNSFWHACRGGQVGVAQYLFEHGADISWIGHDKKAPLDVALKSGNSDLVRWLKDQGAKSAR